MSRYLGRRGFEAHAVDLVPSDGSARLDNLAEQVARYAAERLPRETPFDLVGFSMGGVVCRYYLQRMGGVARVRRFVSISSPHHGTATAYLQRRPGCVQMRPGSELLRDLDRDVEMLGRIDVTSIWTPLDLVDPAPRELAPPGRARGARAGARPWADAPRPAGAPRGGRGAVGMRASGTAAAAVPDGETLQRTTKLTIGDQSLGPFNVVAWTRK